LFHPRGQAAAFRAQDLLMALGQVGLTLERCEERQVSLVVRLTETPANQLQGGPKLRLRQLIHQVMQFLPHDAHASKCGHEKRRKHWPMGLLKIVPISLPRRFSQP
jgi:hypothetical protein